MNKTYNGFTCLAKNVMAMCWPKLQTDFDTKFMNVLKELPFNQGGYRK